MKTRNSIQLIVLMVAVLSANSQAKVNFSISLFSHTHTPPILKGPLGRHYAAPPIAARPPLHSPRALIRPMHAEHRRPLTFPVIPYRPVELIVPPIAPAPLPQQTVTVWITNHNGSITPVVLVRDGLWYVGPKGERYFNLPDENQLRPLYGLPCEPVASDNISVWLTNQYGARIVVNLTRTRDGFIGPRGELYHYMPTEDQLMMVYGR